MSLWVMVVLTSLGSYGLKLAGVSLPRSVLNHPRVQRTAYLLPPAMLTALIMTGLFDANGHYGVDWPVLAGVGTGAVAMRFKASLVTVFIVAIVTCALLQLIA